jgi:hypothetical protein
MRGWAARGAALATCQQPPTAVHTYFPYGQTQGSWRSYSAYRCTHQLAALNNTYAHQLENSGVSCAAQRSAAHCLDCMLTRSASRWLGLSYLPRVWVNDFRWAGQMKPQTPKMSYRYDPVTGIGSTCTRLFKSAQRAHSPRQTGDRAAGSPVWLAARHSSQTHDHGQSSCQNQGKYTSVGPLGPVV